MEWIFSDTNKWDFFWKSKKFIYISLFGNAKPSTTGVEKNPFWEVKGKYSEIYTSIYCHPEFGHCQIVRKLTFNVKLKNNIIGFRSDSLFPSLVKYTVNLCSKILQR